MVTELAIQLWAPPPTGCASSCTTDDRCDSRRAFRNGCAKSPRLPAARPSIRISRRLWPAQARTLRHVRLARHLCKPHAAAWLDRPQRERPASVELRGPAGRDAAQPHCVASPRRLHARHRRADCKRILQVRRPEGGSAAGAVLRASLHAPSRADPGTHPVRPAAALAAG